MLSKRRVLCDSTSSDSDDESSNESLCLRTSSLYASTKTKRKKSSENNCHESASQEGEAARRRVIHFTKVCHAPKSPLPSNRRSNNNNQNFNNHNTKENHRLRKATETANWKPKDVQKDYCSSSSSDDDDDDDGDDLFHRFSSPRGKPHPKVGPSITERRLDATKMSKRTKTMTKSQNPPSIDLCDSDSDSTIEYNMKRIPKSVQNKALSSSSPSSSSSPGAATKKCMVSIKPKSSSIQSSDSPTRGAFQGSSIQQSPFMASEDDDDDEFPLGLNQDDNKDDDNDASSVDTVELTKMVPTKPGVQRPEFKVSCSAQKRSRRRRHSPPPDENSDTDNDAVSFNNKIAITGGMLQEKYPLALHSSSTAVPRKTTDSPQVLVPTAFQLPEQGDSSSPSESESEVSGNDDHDLDEGGEEEVQDLPNDFASIRNDTGEQPKAPARPVPMVFSNGVSHTQDPQPQHPIAPLYNPYANTKRSSKSASKENATLLFGGCNHRKEDFSTNSDIRRPHSSSKNDTSKIEQELFDLAFPTGSTKEMQTNNARLPNPEQFHAAPAKEPGLQCFEDAIEAGRTVERPGRPHFDDQTSYSTMKKQLCRAAFDANEDFQRPQSRWQQINEKELFQAAFGANEELQRHQSPWQQTTRSSPQPATDERDEADLFHAAFMGETPAYGASAYDFDVNHKCKTHHDVRQGISRREPLPAASPSYNLAARTFMKRNQRSLEDHYSNDLHSSTIDLIDDYLEDKSSIKPAPRRITEDHAHHLNSNIHLQQDNSPSLLRESNCYPGKLSRPWEPSHFGATRRKKLVRDAAASNHALAASVVTGRTRRNLPATMSKDIQDNETLTSNVDIRSYFRRPLVDPNVQQVKEKIKASRHDIEGHSEVKIVNRQYPSSSRNRSQVNDESATKENVLLDDDVIEVFDDDEPDNRIQHGSGQNRRRQPTRTKRARGRSTSSSRPKSNSGRKRGRFSSRGKGRGRGGGSYARRGRGGGNTGNEDGVWGGDHNGGWAASSANFRHEDPAFQGIGAEISF